MSLFNGTFAETVEHVKINFSKDIKVYAVNLRAIVMYPEIYLAEHFTPSPYDIANVMKDEGESVEFGNVLFSYPAVCDKEGVYLLNTSYLWDMGGYIDELNREGFVYYEYEDYRVYYIPH